MRSLSRLTQSFLGVRYIPDVGESILIDTTAKIDGDVSRLAGRFVLTDRRLVHLAWRPLGIAPRFHAESVRPLQIDLEEIKAFRMVQSAGGVSIGPLDRISLELRDGRTVVVTSRKAAEIAQRLEERS